MGRDARGVRGIALRAGDRLVSMCTFSRDSDATLTTVCGRGYGKRTALSDYPRKNRGGKGVITIKTTARNGKVAAARIVSEDDHLILISDKGKLIRLRIKDIPLQGRATQGVRVMRLEDAELVVAIERLAEPDEESGIAVGAPEAGAEDVESASAPDDGGDGNDDGDDGDDEEEVGDDDGEEDDEDGGNDNDGQPPSE
jgi:DNA gyrase subunit A